VLLGVSTALASQRARDRARQDASRSRDTYERDNELQQRTGAVYSGLAAAGWGGRWLVVDVDVDASQLAARLTA
jgi:dTMP kinase